MGLHVRLQFPDGKVEQLIVDADRALIGSGAHCEIKLPAEHAAPEHVEVELAPTGVFARARSLDPAPTLNGAAFTQGPLLPGSALMVGKIEVVVSAAEASSEGARVATRKREQTSPMTYLLAAIAVPASLYIIFGDEPADEVTMAPKQVPAIFDGAVVACREATPEAAAAVARDKLVLADGKRERRPFHVQDGVAAVPLFETAAACFRAANDPESAADADAAAKHLRSQVEEDYRTHRVRLEHAIEVSDWTTAQKEVRVLRAFLQGRQGEYVSWLSNLDRKLQVKYGKKG